jgi:hypothetical protein
LLEIFKLDVSLKVYLAIITGHLYKKGLVLYSKLWIEAVLSYQKEALKNAWWWLHTLHLFLFATVLDAFST